MAIMFYPHVDDTNSGSMKDRIEVLSEAAQRYKAAVMDLALKNASAPHEARAAATPKEITHAFNWEEIAVVLREIRESSESTNDDKLRKSEFLMKLAEIYETLRDTKMPKLEAVRLALTNEAMQLRGSANGSAAPP